jgi:hypothetical protein
MIDIATAVWSSPSTQPRRVRGPSAPSRKRPRLPDILTRLTTKPPTLFLQALRLPPEPISPRPRPPTQQPLLSRPLEPPILLNPLLAALSSPPVVLPLALPLSPLPRTKRTSPPRLWQQLRALALSPRRMSVGLVSLLPWLVSSRACSSKRMLGSWHVSKVGVIVDICVLQSAQGVEV